MSASGELRLFIWIAAGTVAIAVPLILKKVRLPRHLELETLSDNQLTDKQRDFFASYDSRLKDMGYAPCVTYRMSNIPGSKNLLRTYISSTDPVRCTVQVSAAAKGPVQFDQVQFVTEFADQSRTFTTNRNVSPTFDCEPDKFVQECRGIRDVAELKRRHDQFSEQYQTRAPVFTDSKNYLVKAQQYYEKEVTHQVNQKLLRLDKANNEYRVTLKWALRMQRNMFNPFADNFTLFKLAAAIAAGSLPVLVSLAQVQLAHGSRLSAQANLGWAPMLMLAYAVAGVAAGLLFGHKSFLWAFLLAYVPTLFLPPSTSHPIGMSLIMAWVADLTFRVQGGRRRLV
ncbi:MAG: hypothetical protein ACLPHP_19155 [Candidatus Sulfotelmatobacter sp.]